MVLFTIAWPQGRSHEKVVRKSFAHFDVVGSVLLLLASILVVFGLHEGGTGTAAWDSALVIATLVIGAVCWIALFLWSFVLSQPRWSHIAAIYPSALLSHRVLVAGIMLVPL